MTIDPKLLYTLKSTYLKLRTITNQQRIYIFNIIDQYPSIQVGTLVEMAQIEQPIVSQCLAVLKKSGFVSSVQKNKYVYYSTEEVSLKKLIQLANTIFLKSEKNRTSSLSELLSKNYSQLTQLMHLLKLINSSPRITILEKIVKEDVVNVSKIIESTQMKQSIVSHNLAILQSHQLICNEKRGREVYYSINSAFWNQLVLSIEQYMES